MPRLPRSSESRSSRGHLKLLTAVDLDGLCGLQFRGKLLIPGSEFEPRDLPRPAVLIENAGSVRTGPHQRRDAFSHLWILWRFDFDRELWIEVIRATSQDSSWTFDFAPAAHRLLYAAPRLTSECRVRPIVDELRSLIDRVTSEVTIEERGAVLAAIETFVAGEMIAIARRIPAGSARSPDWARRLSA